LVASASVVVVTLGGEGGAGAVGVQLTARSFVSSRWL
jgi:hypothetical protein